MQFRCKVRLKRTAEFVKEFVVDADDEQEASDAAHDLAQKEVSNISADDDVEDHDWESDDGDDLITVESAESDDEEE